MGRGRCNPTQRKNNHRPNRVLVEQVDTRELDRERREGERGGIDVGLLTFIVHWTAIYLPAEMARNSGGEVTRVLIARYRVNQTDLHIFPIGDKTKRDALVSDGK